MARRGGHFAPSGLAMPTLHIHLDESGDWGFHPKGSKYLILAAAWTFDPKPLAGALSDLRFSLVRTGIDIESFHASHDKQSTRDAVVAILAANPAWWFGAVVLEKCKVNPALHDPRKFYPQFASTLLRFILRGSARTSTTKALIFADTIPTDTKAKREGILKAIKETCSSELGRGCEHHAFSHCHQSNQWIQIADDGAWAIRRKWEKGDTRTYDVLRPRMVQSELEITARSDGTTYY